MTHGTSYGYKCGCRCDECRSWKRTYSKNWLAERPGYMKRYQTYYPAPFDARRSRWFFRNIRVLKAAQGCSLCGRKDGRLDHHHVDPSTHRYGISQMTNCSLEVFMDELAKCVVLCVHCHAVYHHGLREIDRDLERGLL